MVLGTSNIKKNDYFILTVCICSVNANLRSVVYCYALRHSDNSEDWEFLWQKYLDTKLSTEENTIISALGCTKNTTLLYE